MKRAIVIKGANFSANKLKTVTLIEVKPCTGITFSEDTFSLTGYDTATVQYSLTPNDTTDAVTWESSNTNIVTISNGVITPVGVGTCTITAHCGNQTATAEVSCRIFYLPNFGIGLCTLDSSLAVLKVSDTNNRLFTKALGAQVTEHVVAGKDYGVVKMPKNTSRVKISVSSTSDIDNSSNINVCWAKDESTPNSNPTFIHGLSSENAYNIITENEKIFNVPTNADSIAVTIKLRISDTLENMAATLESDGFTIEFLPPAS